MSERAEASKQCPEALVLALQRKRNEVRILGASNGSAVLSNGFMSAIEYIHLQSICDK
jgi:hypothetical protein